MNLQSKYSDLLLNLLVALAISLVVNFSYVLLLIVEQKGEGQPRPARASVVTRSEEGVLHVSTAGHGYILYGNRDSVYVPMQRIRRMDLSDGDRLVVDVVAPRRYGAHPVMNELRMRNGEEFDYSTLYNRPSRTSELTLQLIYYLVVSFIMLSILTSARRNYKAGRFALHCMGCLVAAAALYILAPVREWHSGQIVLNFMSGHIFDYMLLLKCSFAVAVSMLYGWVYVLNSKQQAVVMENERLKNENLTTRYNMLVGQINPHFFFNSLNSLAMLGRERQDDKALVYIDQLSYTFRYIIQNGQSTLMTLGEDLIFAVDGVALDAVPGPDDDGGHQAAGLQRCFQLGVGFLVQLAEGVLGAGGQLLQWQLHGVVLVRLLLRQLAEQRGICPLFGGLLRPLLTLPIHLGIVKHGDLAHIPLGIWIGAFAVFQHNGFLL